MTVTLEWYELSEAAHVGALRHVESIRRGMTRPDGTTPRWDEDVEGAAAERVVAKTLGLYWSGSVNGLHSADVGAIGVRHAVDRNRRLILRERDFARYGDEAVFVFVTGQRGAYEVHGWISAGEARREEWRDNPNGWGEAYFVPRQALRPLDDLGGD